MNIYYIYFFITLIFFGIIVLIYYNFNRNIEKFNPLGSTYTKYIEEYTEEEAKSSLLDTLMRDGTLECSWSNTRDAKHECHGKTGNEVCTKCPPGQEPTNFNGEGFICTQVSECKVNCLTVSSNDFHTSPNPPHEHLGYKYFKENEEKTISGIKMNDPACTPSRQCPTVNIPSCDIRKFTIVTEINDDEKLCCKYEKPDPTVTDIDSCPPAPGECPLVYRYEHFPADMREDVDNTYGGVKLLVSSNNTRGYNTPTWADGGAYAFRGCNYPPISYTDECPQHDELYSNLNAQDNCVTVGNDAYCCPIGKNNKPTLVHERYPTCELTYVNLLNSVNTGNAFVTSNIIQMYSGYNLFDTNFYHVVHASNAEKYGFLSNDVFYGCISNDGSLSNACKVPDNHEFELLPHEDVSTGIYGDDPSIDVLNAIASSTPLRVLGYARPD